LHIPLRHLSEVEQSLENAYIELTSSSVEFHGREAEAVQATTDGASDGPVDYV